MQVFGEWGADCYFEKTGTPVGEPCAHCQEIIVAGDRGFFQPADSLSDRFVFHRVCFIRGIVGSVAHQKGTCTCAGGEDADPPGMTRREAAAAAVEYYESLHAVTGPNLEEKFSIN